MEFEQINNRKISIIIPVLNEEENIGLVLDYLLKIGNTDTIEEIIVVDGGSDDTTVAIAQSYTDVIVLKSPKGRAVQMNAGAKMAEGSILYFLHCDSFPPLDFDLKIVEEVQKNRNAGCFKMKFDSNHIVLKVSQWFTKFNHQACRGGDQSLFITKDLFQKLNGFNEKYTIYEDNELIGRIYKSSAFTVIQQNIVTSSRKYKVNGYWKLQYHFFIIHAMNALGFEQIKLVNYYKKNIR